ncbi:MAG: UDP-N-acetylenolpyruvoylglucosamine reductase [Chlorobiaceae bacterium]|nr:UDP-N-acetylenolpyruvoylglucosamine reductase [Chlorobiaceae bacterium]
MINIDDIKKFFRGTILLSESMSNHTTFRIGGPADYFFKPENKEDAVDIIRYLQKNKLPFFALGKGSNLLVSDDGYRGAVVDIESALKSIYAEENQIYAEAGVALNRFVDFSIQEQKKGVEMLAGIPGTVGGAIVMNAGAYGGEISNYICKVEILRNGSIVILGKDQLGFSYRRSSLTDTDVVLNGWFELPDGNTQELMKIRNELILQRNRKHPINYPNCGSVFKNPKGSTAAKLVEDAGLKGMIHGAAQISERHGNFIINLGGAKAKDVYYLIETVQKTVFEKFNIQLELEVKLLGYSQKVNKEIIN